MNLVLGVFLLSKYNHDIFTKVKLTIENQNCKKTIDKILHYLNN